MSSLILKDIQKRKKSKKQSSSLKTQNAKVKIDFRNLHLLRYYTIFSPVCCPFYDNIDYMLQKQIDVLGENNLSFDQALELIKDKMTIAKQTATAFLLLCIHPVFGNYKLDKNKYQLLFHPKKQKSKIQKHIQQLIANFITYKYNIFTPKLDNFDLSIIKRQYQKHNITALHQKITQKVNLNAYDNLLNDIADELADELADKLIDKSNKLPNLIDTEIEIEKQTDAEIQTEKEAPITTPKPNPIHLELYNTKTITHKNLFNL
jgi:hypothetical protein